VPSSTLYALRAIEEEAVKARSAELVVKLAPEVGVYVLNKKRTELHSLERRYGIRIEIELSELLVAPDMEIERIGTAPAYPIEEMPPITIIEEPDEDIPDDEEDEEEIVSSEEESSEEPREAKPRRERDGDAEGGRSRGRRRRRGGRGRDRDGDAPREPKIVVEGELPEVVAAEDGEKDGAEPAEATLTDTAKNDDDKGGRRRRRRGRRGGRQRKEGEGEITSPGEALEAEATDAVAADSEMSAPEVAHAAVIAEPVQADAELTDEVDPDAKPKRVRKPRVTKKAAEAAAKLAAAPEAAISIPQVSQTAVAPVKIATAPAPVVAEAAVEAKAEVLPPEGVILDGNGQPIAANASRKGWWSRTFG
jgi:ribonuclease E